MVILTESKFLGGFELAAIDDIFEELENKHMRYDVGSNMIYLDIISRRASREFFFIREVAADFLMPCYGGSFRY